MCVQRFDDSLNSAIHITYRISLRSSSMPEPRDPLLKVLIHFCFFSQSFSVKTRVNLAAGGPAPHRGEGPPEGSQPDAEATV